jgi:uroporphyrinogen decarboxylase
MEENSMKKMTPKERIEAILAEEKVDRVPHFPFILGFCAKNLGLPIATIYNDAEKSFDAQLKTFEQYGVDWGPIYGYASYGTWEFGGEVEMPSGNYQQAPAHKMFPMKTESDIEGLSLPDPAAAGCLPIAMDFSKLQQTHGVPISVVLGGNFTIAGNICAVEKLCRWMLKQPDTAHRILRLATDHVTDIVGHWADTFGAENVIPQFWEPLSANLIISPRQFEQFVLPYLTETAEKILAMGVRHILYHICGDQNANLLHWAKVPMGEPGLCSFGEEIDIDMAIETLGSKAVIIGNIDPSILLTGRPEQITERCRQTIEKGKKAPRGFMLSSGCEVSPETPGYHVYLMKKALDEFGSYEK